MGPKSHNRFRGYGHRMTPNMVSYASSTSSTSNSSRRSSKSSMAVLMTQNNELRIKDENNTKRISDLEVKIEQSENRHNQLFELLLQKLQLLTPHSPGTQQSGQSQPPYPQQSGQSQPPPTYLYTGHNQQPPYPMYLMPTQPMTYMQQLPMAYMQQPLIPYMQQPPMSYMQQPPYQEVPVYRPVMAALGGFCPEVPA